MENLAQFQRRLALEVIDRARWDHVWLYKLIDQLRTAKRNEVV